MKTPCQWEYKDALKFYRIKDIEEFVPQKIPHLPTGLYQKIVGRLEDDFTWGGAFNTGSKLRRSMTVNYVVMQ